MFCNFELIPVPSAVGAPDEGVADGPRALRAAGLLSAVHRSGHAVAWSAAVTPVRGMDRWDALTLLCTHLADHVADGLHRGLRPLVVGGDHSIAAGTWRGAARALGRPIGLLWVDAHLDAHTRADSRSGNPHGMPLALLLGEGDARIAAATLPPARVCVLGARRWEREELERLMRLGVRVIADAEIHRRGLAACVAEAMARVAADGAGFGISIDLDVFPPTDAPGVSTPAPGGVPAADWLAALRGLAARPDCVAVEITECDGARDADGRTAALATRLVAALGATGAEETIALEAIHGAHNYAPLPVVLERAEGCHAWDVDGNEYIDMMAAYSAVSFGHAHPRLVRALADQAGRLAVTSRAFHNDVLPAFLRRLTELTGYERALPVNTGLEAVETALKAARKWGYEVKGIAPDCAEIIACDGNFHGRSIAIVGLSSDAGTRGGFGPFPPGLLRIPYGDAAALEAAITPRTAAFLVEPIQGEGGIIVPPPGYLRAVAEICRSRGVLLLADEVQTGLGRTGHLYACQHEGVRPDGLILGKALGGGLYPVSAFLADRALMDVFRPGDHGSTFGGNPLGAAVALAALDLFVEEQLAERAARLGERFMARLRALRSPLIQTVRGRGLLIGLVVEPRLVSARRVAEALLGAGILTKDAHETVIRLAPPLVIDEPTIDTATERIAATLDDLHPPLRAAS